MTIGGAPVGAIKRGVVAICLGCNLEWPVRSHDEAERLVAEHTGPGHRLHVRGYTPAKGHAVGGER